MQRDWDLVRKILLAVEAQGTVGCRVEPTSIPGYDEEKVVYHMEIMDEAGLIKTWATRTHDKPPYRAALSMTWDGHEFLDKIRKDNLWQKVKSITRENGLALSFDVIKIAAKLAIDEILPSKSE